jgi:hypothetical protein
MFDDLTGTYVMKQKVRYVFSNVKPNGKLFQTHKNKIIYTNSNNKIDEYDKEKFKQNILPKILEGDIVNIGTENTEHKEAGENDYIKLVIKKDTVLYPRPDIFKPYILFLYGKYENEEKKLIWKKIDNMEEYYIAVFEIFKLLDIPSNEPIFSLFKKKIKQDNNYEDKQSNDYGIIKGLKSLVYSNPKNKKKDIDYPVPPGEYDDDYWSLKLGRGGNQKPKTKNQKPKTKNLKTHKKKTHKRKR